MASRTPSPDYTHPAAFFTPPTQSEEVFSPCCCCIVFIQHTPACRNGVHPRLLWNVTSPRRPEPWVHLQTEIDSFVGWLLELLPLPYDRSGDSCAGSFGPGRRSSEDVAWESVYAGMKLTLYMRWNSASERRSTQAGATSPLQWQAIVIAIGF